MPQWSIVLWVLLTEVKVFTEDGVWDGQGQCFLLLRCEQAEQSLGWIPLWDLMPNSDSRVGLSVHEEGIPCLFPESSVFWLLLSLSDPGTWADSLPFSELEFPSLRGCMKDLGSLGLLSSRSSR